MGRVWQQQEYYGIVAYQKIRFWQARKKNKPLYLSFDSYEDQTEPKTTKIIKS